MNRTPPDSEYRLRVVESAYSSEIGREFALASGTSLIGRDETCEVALTDALVSRAHAEISITDAGPIVTDRASANGLWVEDRQVSSCRLEPGQRFRLGTTLLEVVWQEARRAEPVRPRGESLLDEGELVEASGNNPFLLDDPDAAWIVEAGRIEIFTVEVREGKAVGARSHYLTVDEGHGFLGMDLESHGAGYGFLAVGKMGTKLCRIRISRLQALAESGVYSADIAAIVERWILRLSRSLTQEIIPGPVVELGLASGEKVSMERGQKASSTKGVLWLNVERGDLLYIGMESLVLSRRELFPVTPDGWVEAANEAAVDTELVPLDTGGAIREPALWRGLALFHKVLCQCEFINKRLEFVDEFQRLRTKAEYSRVARDGAMDDLASVLRTEPVLAEEPADEEAFDDLYRAMTMVGQAQGIQIRSHPSLKSDLDYDDRVSILAKASRVRARTVALRDDWWNRDQGPILARLDDSERPVALLPAGPGSYHLADPATGKKTPVTEEKAATLWSFGHTFYRPFPEGKLGVVDLVRFGVRDLSRDVLILVVIGVALGILGSLTPLFTGRIFDSAIPAAEKGLLAQFVFGLVVAALASAAFRITQNIASLRIQAKMDYSIQAALWDRLLDLPSTFFRGYSAGDLADRAAGVNAIRGIVAGAGVASILGAFSSIFYVVLMVWYSGRLAALAIGLTVVFVGFTTAANYLQLTHQRKQFARQGLLSGLVLQLISGVEKLRVAGAENHAFRVWAQKFAEMRRTKFTIGRIQNSVAVFGSSFPIFSSMAIFFGLVLMQSKQGDAGLTASLSTGQFIAFTTAFAVFLGAMQSLSDASLGMLEAMPIYERFKPIITTPAEIDETKAYPGKLSGEIELSHLHFRYVLDGPWVLKDLSLNISPGEFVAFVGPSGSGKSTVMRLMLGFEIPEKGSVYYDGQDLGNLDLREVRQQMGVVLQESKALPIDIFRNIVGSSSRTIDDAWEAARMAGLEQDIREMPMGMYTYVSEGGGGLSGGQLQRLLIARAVVNRPRIIFMDEATSALDNRTQATVTESLDRLRATRIVIAHRLSTIMNADRICYLEAGEIKEVGSYDELIELDGQFAELARRQLA